MQQVTAARRTCTIGLAQGLHLRPVQRLASVVTAFDSIVRLTNGERQAIVSGVLSLMTLGLAPNASVEISAEGTDASQTVEVIRVLLQGGSLLGNDEQSSGKGSDWCGEVASIAGVFDADIRLEAGDHRIDPRNPDELSLLRSVGNNPWLVRASGPDGPRAKTVLDMLLGWLGSG